MFFFFLNAFSGGLVLDISKLPVPMGLFETWVGWML